MEEKGKKPTAIEMFLSKLFFMFLGAVTVMILVCAVLSFMADVKEKEAPKKDVDMDIDKPNIVKEYLTPNTYSRSQRKLKQVKGIVIHYTANPGSSAMDNRNYFENLRKKKTTYASSHFIVGLKGEIVQCMPLSEIAYASNKRNIDTISIECCHPDSSGKFSKRTYKSLIHLVAWLSEKYHVKQENIIRHYDVTGKMCPKYYVKHKKAWKKLKKDVKKYRREHREKLEPAKKEENVQTSF